jgi:TolB-like protein/DNA-binding winged helix-turn-helix (wHTH) protein
MPVSYSKSPVRFGLFELDLEAKHLYRNGLRIRLARQPFELLSILLERPDEVVTREELRERLWGPEVFVDFEHGLNKSVQKLREALGDSAESPRYIETIQRTGYRFIAPVSTERNRLAAEEDNALTQTDPASSPGSAYATPAPRAATRHRSWWLAAGAAAVAIAGVAAWIVHARSASAAAPVHSIAVLPLENISGDPNQEYFADGMTDELTTMLARDSTLRITSRTSVMQYKNAHRPLAEIARALHADAIVEGSVSRTPERVHMTVQLIRADTDSHMWAQSYDRNADDIAALPDAAAHEIAARLKSSSTLHAAATRYVNPAAHDAYLRGHYLWTVGRNDEAGKYFRQAVELQPDYAAGWAGLSEYYNGGTFEGLLNPLDVDAEGKAAAEKAVQLDDTLAQAHLVMAAALFFADRNGEGALAEIKRATELDPESAQAIHLHALILSGMGRYEEAIAVQKQGTAIDPIAHPVALAEIFSFARQYDRALEDAQMRLRDFPQDEGLLSRLVDIYHWKGMDRESAEMVARLNAQKGDRQPNQEVMYAFESEGHKGVVRWRLANMKHAAKSGWVSPMALARFHAQLGERDKTFALLNQAFDQRDPRLLFIRTDPSFDFLHDDPRYRSLIQKIGLWPSN